MEAILSQYLNVRGNLWKIIALCLEINSMTHCLVDKKEVIGQNKNKGLFCSYTFQLRVCTSQELSGGMHAKLLLLAHDIGGQ